MQNENKLEHHRLSDIVAQKIVEYIKKENLGPGDKIPSEKQFSEIFGTGRTSIREGISRLSSIGLLHAQQGYGIVINEITVEKYFEQFYKNGLNNFILFKKDDIRHMGEARYLIESFACKKYLENESRPPVENMSDCLLLMRECMYSGDLAGFLKHDFHFHEMLVNLADNNILSSMYHLIRPTSLREFEMILTENNMPVIQQSHELLYRYLIECNPKIIKELKKHLEYLEDDSIDNLVPQQDEDCT
jgi:DNA-binding FadR family transcriptional regulator